MNGTRKMQQRQRLNTWQRSNLTASTWGDDNTFTDRILMFFIRLLMIWPLKSTAIAVYGYGAWRLCRRLQGLRLSPAKHTQKDVSIPSFLARLGLHHMVRFWISLEGVFCIFYLYKLRRLQAQTAKPAQMNRYTQGHALEVCQRIFKATDDIHAGGKIVDPTSQSPCNRSALTPESSAHDLQSLLVKRNESNVEQLLRDWDALQEEGAEVPKTLPQRSSSLSLPAGSMKRSLSRAEVQLFSDAEMLALKRAEVSGWFLNRVTQRRWPAARLEEIGQGNLAEFNAWVFFHCAPDEVPAERRAEFQQISDDTSAWVAVKFPTGYNPAVQSMRLTMDTIKAEYRPLAYYVVTALAIPTVTKGVLASFGFHRYRSGTLKYWCRPSALRSSSTGDGGIELPPFVICPGIGVDAIQYVPLIMKVLEIAAGRAIFIVSLPHLTMQLKEDVPSSAEMVPCISDMLASWGYSSAHFIGHSFGSILMAWVARRAPSLVSMATFIDPVCFLLIKPDVCYNFVYRKPLTPTQLFMSYFGARELYIANSLSRNFFWSENILWPEQLSMPTLVVLSGRDCIVPAHSVRRYLTSYKQRHKMQRLKVQWFPRLGHGEINLNHAGRIALDAIAAEIVSMETALHEKHVS